MLYDNHGREINYMRLAVTDRCNLRCQYCMPECGIEFTSRSALMSYEEMLRLCRIVSEQGISKVRITGGEPFVRKDLMHFLTDLVALPTIEKVNITSNGTLLEDKIDALARLGINSINLSLDSLDRARFFEITRRDDLPVVLENLERLIKANFQIKVNMVVMADKNTEDILSMLELARDQNISVRFLEEMPFNGQEDEAKQKCWTHVDILNFIKSTYPNIKKLKDARSSTSMNYQIDGFKGSFGIIASYTRTFCGTCNRIRVTPQGLLKTCLYDHGVFNLRDFMRQGASDEEIQQALKQSLSHRAKDGHEAEANRSGFPISESMASIGG